MAWDIAYCHETDTLLRTLHNYILWNKKRVGCVCFPYAEFFHKMSSFQNSTSLLRLLYILLAQIAECFLLLFQAGHGMLPSTKKACVFLFYKNPQR